MAYVEFDKLIISGCLGPSRSEAGAFIGELAAAAAQQGAKVEVLLHNLFDINPNENRGSQMQSGIPSMAALQARCDGEAGVSVKSGSIAQILDVQEQALEGEAASLMIWHP